MTYPERRSPRRRHTSGPVPTHPPAGAHDSIRFRGAEMCPGRCSCRWPRPAPQIKRAEETGVPSRYSPDSSYAALSQSVNCLSTSAGSFRRTSTCHRPGEVCSRFSMRGVRMSFDDFNVRIKDDRRVATPANAVSRTEWIEVFFGSSATGPSVRAAFRICRYVATTARSIFSKWDATLMRSGYL